MTQLEARSLEPRSAHFQQSQSFTADTVSVQSYAIDDKDSNPLSSLPAFSKPAQEVPKLVKRGQRWTPEEDERLLRLKKKGVSPSELDREFPNRTLGAVALRYHKLTSNLPNPPSKSPQWNAWTDEEEQRLIRLVEEAEDPAEGLRYPFDEWAEYFDGRTPGALLGRYNVLLKAGRIAERPSRQQFIAVRQFTPEEDKLLRALAARDDLTWKQRAERFEDRSAPSLYTRYQRLMSQPAGSPSKSARPLPPGRGSAQRWTREEEDRLIEELENGTPIEEAAKLLGRGLSGTKTRSTLLRAQGRLGQNKYFYTDEEIKLLVKLKEEGMSFRAIRKLHFPDRKARALALKYYRYKDQESHESD